MKDERHVRRAVQLPVSFIGDVRGAGTVRNLSTGGCKIESDIQARDTHLLVLRLSLPQETLPVVIDVAAVRWAKRPTFGVQFLSVKAGEQQRLDRYLAMLPPV
jgi:hypothetical protein